MLYTNSFIQNAIILFINLCLENIDMPAGHYACLVTDFFEKMAFKWCKSDILAAILFMQIRWSRTQNSAWEPGFSDSAYSY